MLEESYFKELQFRSCLSAEEHCRRQIDVILWDNCEVHMQSFFSWPGGPASGETFLLLNRIIYVSESSKLRKTT